MCVGDRSQLERDIAYLKTRLKSPAGNRLYRIYATTASSRSFNCDRRILRVAAEATKEEITLPYTTAPIATATTQYAFSACEIGITSPKPTVVIVVIDQ